jgi:hypothetical protein
MSKFTDWVYYSAAFVNTVGVLIFTKCLTNQDLMTTDPTLFSRFGLLMVMIWGLCYFASRQVAQSQASISLVFALEKLAYFVAWIGFIQGPVDWERLYQSDLFAGLFYSIYGLVDGTYMLLFVYCAYGAYSVSEQNDKLDKSIL